MGADRRDVFAAEPDATKTGQAGGGKAAGDTAGPAPSKSVRDPERGNGRPRPVLRTTKSRDGTSIAFDQSGQGPALILVASALADRSGAARLAGLLAGHFTVINYDRRGRGASGDTLPYAVDREIEDIEALIDHAGGSAFLFGSSSGAVLAIEAAARLPAKVVKLAVYEPPFIVDDTRPPVPSDFLARVTDLVASGRRGDAVEYFMTEGVRVPAESVASMRNLPMWAGLEKLAHTLPYDAAIMRDTQAGRPLPARRWVSATPRALVIDGGRSDAFLRNAAQAIAGVLPRAQRRTLPGQDHGVVARAPGTLAPVLMEFYLEKNDAR